MLYNTEDEVRNEEQKEHKYLYSDVFDGGQKMDKKNSSSRVGGTSLFTCTYIGGLRNGQKFKCENKSFIVFILILSRVLCQI